MLILSWTLTSLVHDVEMVTVDFSEEMELDWSSLEDIPLRLNWRSRIEFLW